MENFIASTFSPSLLCGVIFFIAGGVMYYLPPTKINSLYGYRTPASMKTQERWDFAQRYSTLQMLKGSIALIVVSLVGWVIPAGTAAKVSVGIVLIVLMILYLFISTERALKKRFNEMF